MSQRMAAEVGWLRGAVSIAVNRLRSASECGDPGIFAREVESIANRLEADLADSEAYGLRFEPRQTSNDPTEVASRHAHDKAVAAEGRAIYEETR
jgi:hypothetical protein